MKNTTLLALALAAAGASAHAADISYDYAQLDYLRMKGDESANNVRLSGSATLGDSHFYLTGSYLPKGDIPHYSHTHDDFGMTSFGGGYFWNLGENTTLHTQLTANHNDWTDSAIRFDAGVRHAYGDNWEFGGGIGYIDHDGNDYGKQLLFNANAQYKFNDTWGVVLAAEFGDFTDDNYDLTFDKAYTVGVRASF